MDFEVAFLSLRLLEVVSTILKGVEVEGIRKRTELCPNRLYTENVVLGEMLEQDLPSRTNFLRKESINLEPHQSAAPRRKVEGAVGR